MAFANLQISFKFRPREVGRYTQYWQLTVRPVAAACSDAAAEVLLKFELSGKVCTLVL